MHKQAGFQIKFIWHALRQLKPIVWITFIGALFGVINYEGHIITISGENRILSAINSVINQILITYITGCIFYFLVELIHRNKKKIAAHTSIHNNVHLIRERTEYLLNEISKQTIKKTDSPRLKEEDFFRCCNNLDVDKININVWFLPKCTLREFILKNCEDIKQATEEILVFSDLLDEKWLYSTSKIGGLATRISDMLDIRFATPHPEGYFIWGLWAESSRLNELSREYSKKYVRIEHELNKQNPFFPPGLTFEVQFKK